MSLPTHAKEDSEKILTALAKSSLINSDQKQQAALVLEHIVAEDHSDDSQNETIVRQFAKELKISAPIKYLEMQMTVLRRTFQNELLQSEEEEGFERTKALAKRLSSTLGIGQVASPLRKPLVRFLSEGIRFGLESPPSHFSFLEAMRSYMSHTSVSMKRQLAEQFQALRPQDNDELSSPGGIIKAFEKSLELPGGVQARQPSVLKRKSASDSKANHQSKRRISLSSIGGSSPQSILSSNNHLADIQEYDDAFEVDSQVSIMDKLSCASPSLASKAPSASSSPASSQ